MLFAYATVIGIEVLQYICSLGFFDIVDIVANCMGISMGILAVSIGKDLGWKLTRVGKQYILHKGAAVDSSV